MSPFVFDVRVVYYTNGQVIRKAREAKKLGLREAARQLGISGTYLARIENGNRTSIPGHLLKSLELLFLGKVTP